jgi:phospholipid-translocating ATPase
MIFRECSVGGRLYKGDTPDQSTDDLPLKPLRDSSSDATTPVPVEEQVPNVLTTSNIKLSASVLAHFRDAALTADLRHSVDPDADTAFSRSSNAFFTVLALCHTVIASVDPLTHALEYKAQSPDEAALVQAAADVGFIFRGRDREILRMQTPFSDHVEEYELMNVLEFTSSRKRMSVVVRKLDQSDRRLYLLTKGADNVIFGLSRADENQELKATTEKHLDEFASAGKLSLHPLLPFLMCWLTNIE